MYLLGCEGVPGDSHELGACGGHGGAIHFPMGNEGGNALGRCP